MYSLLGESHSLDKYCEGSSTHLSKLILPNTDTETEAYFLFQSGNLSRDLVVVQCSNWPQQCSPLSTVFDLIKLVDEEQVRMTGGSRETPILVMERNGGSQVARIKIFLFLPYILLHNICESDHMVSFPPSWGWGGGGLQARV